MMAAIRPTQFSALKPLDPLDEQNEYGEDDDRHGHVKKVIHGHSLDGNHAGRPPGMPAVAGTLGRGSSALNGGPGGGGRACPARGLRW